MRVLSFMWQRCTAAAGLRYRGTFVSGGMSCRVYSDQPVESRTDETLQFKGGVALLQKGGFSSGNYGRAVVQPQEEGPHQLLRHGLRLQDGLNRKGRGPPAPPRTIKLLRGVYFKITTHYDLPNKLNIGIIFFRFGAPNAPVPTKGAGTYVLRGLRLRLGGRGRGCNPHIAKRRLPKWRRPTRCERRKSRFNE